MLRTPILLCCISVLGCTLGGADTAADVDYADVEHLWYAECSIACHGGGLGGDDLLSLEEGLSYAELVGQPSEQLPSMNRVQPGNPDESYLWHKLNGTHDDVGGSGEPMPLAWSFSEGGGTTDHYPLDEADLNRVERWILQGAPGLQ